MWSLEKEQQQQPDRELVRNVKTSNPTSNLQVGITNPRTLAGTQHPVILFQ